MSAVRFLFHFCYYVYCRHSTFDIMADFERLHQMRNGEIEKKRKREKTKWLRSMTASPCITIHHFQLSRTYEISTISRRVNRMNQNN